MRQGRHSLGRRAPSYLYLSYPRRLPIRQRGSYLCVGRLRHRRSARPRANRLPTRRTTLLCYSRCHPLTSESTAPTKKTWEEVRFRLPEAGSGTKWSREMATKMSRLLAQPADVLVPDCQSSLHDFTSIGCRQFQTPSSLYRHSALQWWI